METLSKEELKRIYAREYARKRRANDPLFLEKQREAGRKSQAKRRASGIDTTTKWKNENKEKVSKYNKNYSAENSVVINRRRSIVNKQKRKTNPLFVLACRERLRIWEALKGKRKKERSVGLIGCSYEHLKIHIESLFVDGMGWHNMGEWHIDHIRPLASFDLSDTEQQKLAFHYTNQQPLWAADNLKKGAKHG